VRIKLGKMGLEEENQVIQWGGRALKRAKVAIGAPRYSERYGQ